MGRPTGDILSGFGTLVLESVDLPDDVLFQFEALEFSISADVNSVKSKKMKNGQVVVAGTAKNEVTHSLKLTIEAIHAQVLALAYGYLPTTETVAWSNLKQRKVAGDIVVDTAITSTNVLATIVQENGSYQALKQITGTTTPGPDEFKIDVANNRLETNAANNGKTVIYRTIGSLVEVSALGFGSTAVEIGSLKFQGTAYMGTQKVGIIVDKMGLTSEPEISPTEVGSLEFEFDLIPVGDAPKGYKQVFFDY